MDMIEWRIGEPAIVVRCSYTLIGELAELAMAGYRSYPWGGVEVGGVLYGTREPDGVRIAAQRPLECEHEAGPAFRLSARDLERLAELLRSEPEMAAVGWYHTVSRGELALTGEDAAVQDRLFPERWQVAMVLQRSKKEPPRAGLFVRGADGTVDRHRPGLVFAPGEIRRPEPEAEEAVPVVIVEPEPGLSGSRSR